MSIYHRCNTTDWFCRCVNGMPLTHPHVTYTRFSVLPVSTLKANMAIAAKSPLHSSGQWQAFTSRWGNTSVTLLKRSRRHPPFLPVRIRSKRSCIGCHIFFSSSGWWLMCLIGVIVVTRAQDHKGENESIKQTWLTLNICYETVQSTRNK